MLSIDQIISLATCFAALAAALATFFTIREIARQRRASFMPELVISRKSVSLRGAYSSLGIEINWLGDIQQKGFLSQSTKLYNLGLGAAKNICAYWEFDFKAVASALSKVLEKSPIDVKAAYNEKEGVFELSGKDIHTQLHNLDSQCRNDWAYLMPVAISPQGIDLDLPQFYILVYSIGIFAAFHSKNMDAFTSRALSGADMKLKYEDIQNNHYEKRIRIQFHFSYVQELKSEGKEKLSPIEAFVGLEPKEL